MAEKDVKVEENNVADLTAQNEALKQQLKELSTQYEKVVGAFNKLLKEFNELHLNSLFLEDTRFTNK